MNPENLIYISGPHGSGKSTLIADIIAAASEQVIFRPQLAHCEALDDQQPRQIWRNALHAIEHYENIKVAQANPDKLVIGDRCALDDEAYLWAFQTLGWMTAHERRTYYAHAQSTHATLGIDYEYRAVFLLPPLDFNEARIRGRWEAGEPVKWHEDDFDYLRHVHESFRSMSAFNDYVLALETTDRHQRVLQVLEFGHGRGSVAPTSA